MRYLLSLLLPLVFNPALAQEREPSSGRTFSPTVHITFPADGVAVYAGRLIEHDVATFIAAAKTRQVKHLLITSQGGSVLAGVMLGEWVRDNGVAVVVDRLCMSSCANYVFPAGTEKIIRPNSLVLWHGSATQKNFREMRTRLHEVTETLRRGGSLSTDDQAFYDKNFQFQELWNKQVDAQEAFFGSLRIDEYITRMGQEPISFNAAWTVSVETMRQFGITGVLADDQYGTVAYVETAAKHLKLKEQPIALEVLRQENGQRVQQVSR